MLVLASNYGRLGNQLWTYANVLAYGLEHNIAVVNTSFSSYHDYFSQSFSQAVKNTRMQNTSLFNMLFSILYKINLRVHAFPYIQLADGETLNLELDNIFHKLANDRSVVFMSGLYFISANNLEKHHSSITQFFSPVEKWRNNISAIISNAREKVDILIGVHMRQGDYKTYANGVMYYTTKEYIEMMTFLKDQFAGKRVGFIICSDEKQNHDDFNDLIIFSGSSQIIEDLYLLSNCDYIIGPNSSFSQWASFYGRVPLHIIDWRCVEQNGNSKIYGNKAIKQPKLSDFSVFSPHDFNRYSRDVYSFEQ